MRNRALQKNISFLLVFLMLVSFLPFARSGNHVYAEEPDQSISETTENEDDQDQDIEDGAEDNLDNISEEGSDLPETSEDDLEEPPSDLDEEQEGAPDNDDRQDDENQNDDDHQDTDAPESDDQTGDQQEPADEESGDLEPGNETDPETVGLELHFLKSDAAEASVYTIELLNADLTTQSDILGPFYSEVYNDICDEVAYLISLKDANELMRYRWTRGTEKSVLNLLPESVLSQIGLWDVNANFGFRVFMLSQDGEAYAEYVLFIFREEDSDLLRYAIVTLNSIINESDLAALFEQYRNVPGEEEINPEFQFQGIEDVASEEEILMIRDLFKENLEYICHTNFPVESFVKAGLNMVGVRNAAPPIEEDPKKGNDGEKKTDDGQSESSGDTESPEEDTPAVLEPVVEGPTEEIISETPAELLLDDAQLMPQTKSLMRSGLKTLSISRTTGAPVQQPVTADGITIEKLTMRWLSKSSGASERAGFDTLVLVPESDISPNQQWQIDFSLSGNGTVDAGAVEIVIPAYIWKDRDGKEPGLLTLAVPQEPDTNDDFAWKRVGETVVITNTHMLSAGSKYMIQGTFRMTYPDPNADRPFDTTYAHQMVDINTTDTGAEYKGVSDDFYAVLNVMTPRTNEVISMTSNAVKATINTQIEAAAASTTAVGKKVFYEKPDELPAELTPANPGSYIYVQWYIDGRASGNQPFTMTFNDQIVNKAWKLNKATNEYTEFAVTGLMLGAEYTADGTVVSANHQSVSGKLFEGYTSVDKSAYVWVAYPTSAFSEEGTTYKLSNSHTITVVGEDDQVSTTRTATGEVAFRMPIIWKVNIIWDDNNNALGRRPDEINVWLENMSVEGSPTVAEYMLNSGNGWHAEYRDDGSVSNYACYEHSYLVSLSNAYSLAGDSGQWVEFEDGSKYQRYWWYSREKTEYDEGTHTWTFTNVYHDATYWTYLAELDVSTGPRFHYDNNQKSTTDKDLNRLRRGLETTDIEYNCWCSTFALPYTMAEGGDPSDTSQHGKRWVTLELRSYDEHFESRRLNTNDYQISAVDLLFDPTIEIWVPTPGSTNGGGNLVETDKVPVNLYGLRSGNWTQYAVLNTDGTITTMNGASLEDENSRMVLLPDGVEEVKSTLRTNAAKAHMSFEVKVVLKPSAQIRSAVDEIFESTDYGMARTLNRAEATLRNGDNDVIMQLEVHSPAYLHGRNYRLAADLDKEVEFVENNRRMRNLRFSNTITLNQQTNIADTGDYDEYLRDGDLPNSKSGTFYDLLPAGMTADLKSVKLSNGTIKTADIIEDYCNSGRQMLIVKVLLGDKAEYYDRTEDYSSAKYGDATYPESGYGTKHTLSFDMTYGYDEAQSLGVEGLRNYAVYEADEAALGNAQYWIGETDAPSGNNNKESTSAVSSSDSYTGSLLTNLDPNRDDPSFVYAGANVIMTEQDFSALTSITKRVKILGSDRWSNGQENDVNVYEGGKYSYKLQMTSGVDTTSKDIILLDSLENYVVKQTDSDYIPSGQWSWKGSFLSVDVSEIRAMGVNPVIYYSTTADLNIDYYNPGHPADAVPMQLSGGDWTTTMPADPSTVKAIAIDCRTKTDGTSFELNEGESLIAYVHMRAPTYFTDPSAFDEALYADHQKNAHAYNNVFMDVTQIDEAGRVTHAYGHYDYTKVGLMGADLKAVIEWDDLDNNDGIRPTSTTVHLFADGVDTNRSLELSAEGEWAGEFTHVQLFNDNGERIYYSLVDEIPGYECTSSVADDTVTMRAVHEPEKISVPFRKTWSSNVGGGWMSNIPDSIVVRLMKDGTYSGRSLTVRQGVDGTWSGVFENVLRYDKGTEATYSVEETSIPNFITTYNGNTINNEYYPFGDLVVSKRVQNGTARALQTVFHYTLILKDDNGDAITGKYRYKLYDANNAINETGEIGNGDVFCLYDGWRIEIKDIPSGANYKIIEDDASGFVLSAKENDTGKIVSGLPAEAAFTNTYITYGEAAINLTKDLSGRGMTRYQFKFRMYDSEGKAVRAASNALNGTVSFGAIRYSNADDGIEYVYTVQETPGDKPGYVYDDTVYTVKVTPHDQGNGTMTCDIHYYNEEGTEITSMPFHNAYHATGNLVLRAWKTLQARDLQAGEFTFQLLDENDRVIQTKTNAADGTISFDPIVYDETSVGQTKYFFVREVRGNDQTVNYDSTLYGYKVNIIDNGDGTLTLVQSFVDTTNRYTTGSSINPNWPATETDTLPVFKNTLKDGSLSIQKQVTADDPNDIDPSQQFHFKVKLIGPDVEDGQYTYSLEQVTG